MTDTIFKAYDIRGIYGTELTNQGAHDIAVALGQILQEEQHKIELTMVVGEDMRVSSPALKAQVIRGLTELGINVVDVGLVSTPAFYFAVAKYGYDGGMMISASHNPAAYNGIKMVRAGAVPVSKDTGIMRIRDMVAAGVTLEAGRTPGRVSTRTDIVANDVAAQMEYAGVGNVKPFTVVADSANSMGATYLKELFSHLPCNVIEMYFDLDGTFPNHEADPFQEKNNQDIAARIVAEKADLGIATDGDGDRIFFFDNTGQMIDPAIVRGLLAQIFLEQYPGATICYDIRPGRITRDMIEEAGGRPVVTKVGHSLIKEQAIKEGAVFAGESSGHFFVKMDYGMFETPVVVALKLLQYFSRVDAPVSEQVAPFRKYFHSGEINSTVSDKDAVMQRIRETYTGDAIDVSDLDGITIEYPDFWFNVRGSNTEPLLRLNLEARTAEVCTQKTEELLSIIRA